MKKLCIILAALILLLPVMAAAETAVASFYPIYAMALNLVQGIDGVTVVNLAGPETGCLHDYQLQTGDMKVLAKSDVLLINGAGMESYLPMIREAFPALPVTDASEGVILPHTEHDDHDHDDHDHDVNAHIWLDVQNAVIMTHNLCEGMAQAWPEHRTALEANRDAYLLRLYALDKELKATLAPVQGQAIITFHEAFPYFAEAYGLIVEGVIAGDSGEEPSTRQIARTCDLVKEKGVKALFIEPQYPAKSAETIARETGAGIFTLDPVVSGDGTPESYEELMRKNAQVLTEALK